MRWVFTIAVVCIASIAIAQSIGGGSGINNVRGSGASSGGGGGGGCNGTIDLSSGCTLPIMLGLVP